MKDTFKICCRECERLAALPNRNYPHARLILDAPAFDVRSIARRAMWPVVTLALCALVVVMVMAL